MTAPLTSPDCDLQDFPFMPLHVARLRDSDLAAEETPEACWYAVLLWAASWHQIPAASLPDNDAVLARLVGLGRDLRTWRKNRVGALRGFIKCDDGRLYHPVVAEVANEAWDRRSSHSEANENRQTRQQRWRERCKALSNRLREAGVTPPRGASLKTLEEMVECLHAVDDVDGGSSTERRAETSSVDGVEIGKTGTGTGTLFSDADASSVVGEPPDEVRSAFDAYNLLAKRAGLPLAKTLDKSRRAAIAARLREGGMAAWVSALAAVERSPHCRGENDRGWKADLDFVCQPKSWRRLIEGFYGGSAPASTGPLGSDWPEARWAAAVKLWRLDGSWDDRLGPPPGQPGCRVPAGLLLAPQAVRGAA